MKTLLLDQTVWDLVLDAVGNIALATDPYSMAQDAASAVRTFQGEVYYDTLLGMPWLQSILGRYPNAQVVKASAVSQALTVPGVTAARCFLTDDGDRRLGGQIQIEAAGLSSSSAAPFTLPPLPPVPPRRRGQLDYSKDYNSNLISVK